jgi:ribosome modulation factor
MAYVVSGEWFKKGMEAAHNGGFRQKPTWDELGIKTEHEWKSWYAGYRPYRPGLSMGKKDAGFGVPMGECPFKNDVQRSEWATGYQHGQEAAMDDDSGFGANSYFAHAMAKDD